MSILNNQPANSIEYTRISPLGELWLGQVEFNRESGLYELWERPAFELRWNLVNMGYNPTDLIPSGVSFGGQSHGKVAEQPCGP